jgi:hypothetical protein
MDERLSLHFATPAHAVQGQRQDENAERLARLEALMDALADGRAGHRWKSSDMAEWCRRLVESNPALVVPDPADVLLGR